MVRARHGTEHEQLTIYVNGRIHGVLVVRVVTALFVEVYFGDVGRRHMLVAAPYFLVNDKASQHSAERRAFRGPERQPFADRVGKGEQSEFLSDTPMVPLACLVIRIRHMRNHSNYRVFCKKEKQRTLLCYKGESFVTG